MSQRFFARGFIFLPRPLPGAGGAQARADAVEQGSKRYRRGAISLEEGPKKFFRGLLNYSTSIGMDVVFGAMRAGFEGRAGKFFCSGPLSCARERDRVRGLGGWENHLVFRGVRIRFAARDFRSASISIPLTAQPGKAAPQKTLTPALSRVQERELPLGRSEIGRSILSPRPPSVSFHSMKPLKRPQVIIIRDGWGKNPYPQWNSANAVYLARHPVADKLMAEYPNVLIHTSGFDVGLPEGTMGNSEVGHQNIGAGRIVDQESVAITKQCRNGEIFENGVLNAAMTNALENRTSLHLFGIVSDAGVHGLLEHLFGILALAKRRGLDRVYLHAFTDGRDTSPNSGLGYVQQIEAKMREIGVGQVATVSGRYWAMDRDNRWDRVEKAYLAMTAAQGPKFTSAEQAIKHYYDNPLSSNMSGDEFVPPSVITKPDGSPIAQVRANDSVIFYNYRGDRPREITKAFVYDTFPFEEKAKGTAPAATYGFTRGPKIPLYFATMTAYETSLPVHVAYPKPPKMVNTLGEYVSNLGLKQFRSAETEKFPHVTFFFNDYREEPFPGEDRQIVPSPKFLADGTPLKTYDQMPEMSAYGVCAEVVKRVDSGLYDLVVVNFANGDMVGHTGSLPATIKAVEHVDICCGRVLEAVRRQNGVAIVLADHGNCEQMIDPATGGPHTAHTTYDVELIVMDDRFKGKKLVEGGRLADVAPTALHMMGLDIPTEMNGKPLIRSE